MALPVFSFRMVGYHRPGADHATGGPHVKRRRCVGVRRVTSPQLPCRPSALRKIKPSGVFDAIETTLEKLRLVFTLFRCLSGNRWAKTRQVGWRVDPVADSAAPRLWSPAFPHHGLEPHR